MIDYGFTKQLDTDFESAVELVKERLRQEGFGIVTTTDLRQKFEEMFGVDFERYIVLAVCDPANTYKAICAEENAGLMLPCNVAVYERKGRTTVAAVRPTVAIQMIDNPDLKRIAKDIERKLKNVIDSLQPVGAAP
jgi:uncharacterized protein (DUF302 family)